MTKPRRIKSLVKTVPDGTQTAAQHKALEWLKERGGDGMFDRWGKVVAQGERSMALKATWYNLQELGLVEVYMAPKRRIRVTKRN